MPVRDAVFEDIEEICALLVSDSHIDEQQLRIHCESRLAPPFVPKRFLHARELPRNEMGKIDRLAVRRAIPSMRAATAA